MAVHIERIALILSALRASSISSELDSDTPSLSASQRESAEGTLSIGPELHSGLVCRDVDYATAELIGNKLILHMAQAYQLIKGTERISLPSVKPLDQKQILLSLLPEEFGHAVLVKEAATQGISPRTAERWNEGWQQSGVIYRLKYDCYKKIA